MSERGSGFGPFLLGLTVGAAIGLLFAPEPGDATRTKVTRRLRGLRDLAAEKAGELGQLLEAEMEAEDEEAPDEPPAREAVERRLSDAKRRRRGGAAAKGGAALPPPPAAPDAGEEEDEPLA